ncbi:MAG: HD family phosphohydrolase [Eubacteriales bacterium]
MQKKKKLNKLDRKIFLQSFLGVLTFCTTIITVFMYAITKEFSIENLIGLAGFLVLLFLVLYFYIYTQKKEIIDSKNTLFLLFTIYHVILISFILILDLHYFLLPILIAGMLIALLLDTHLAIIVNIFFAILASILNAFGLIVIIFYLISGTISNLLIKQTKQRKNIIWVAIALLGTNALVTMFLSLLVEELKSVDILFAVLNGGFSLIFVVGSLPLWEPIFDVVTPLKLLELSNSDQKLFQRLLIEAPGTFHHSQLVANLAETATTDIGGDYLLARAGGLYHDIGKLKNPELFKENQNGDNKHDEMEPEKSAKIILDHVSYGVKLANEYNLPKNVRSIISQHQGTTIIKYFYHKAKETHPLRDIDEEKYRYKGPEPMFNEAAIVMLADSVEASVRAIPQNEKNLEKIEDTVNYIIKMKLEEGQLDKCDLKIKELSIIANAFMKVYKGMYHERIIYPTDK